MRIRKAKLISREIDGIEVIFNTVPLGKVYEIDLDSKQKRTWLNLETIHSAEKDVVLVKEDGKFCNWFMLDLLELLPDENLN